MNYVILEKSVPSIVKKQRNKGLGKLGLQKTVSEDDFEVTPKEAAKLHHDLEDEHVKKMEKFDDVIADIEKRMKKLDPDSKEYKRLHSIISVNKVEKERHRQHATSHGECRAKHKKLARLYEREGIPGEKEIDAIIEEKTV